MTTSLEAAQQLVQQGRLQDAEQLLRDALAKTPDAATALLLAQILWQLGRHTEALQAARENAAAAPTPLFMQALIEMSSVLAGGREALGVAKQALGIFPDDPNLLTARLALEMQLELLHPAIRTANRLLELAPGHLPARVNRQTLMLKAGHFQHALEDCTEAAEVLGAHVAFSKNRIAALISLERYSEALRAADEALVQFGSDLGLVHNRITSLVALEQQEPALRALDEAVACFGRSPGWSILRMAALLLSEGREADAISEAIQAAGEFGTADDLMAELTEPLAACDRNRGLAELRSRIRESPAAAAVGTGWARSLLASRRYGEAADIVSELRSLGGSAPLLDHIELVTLSANGEFAAAEALKGRVEWPAFSSFYHALRRLEAGALVWKSLPEPAEIAASEFLVALDACEWTKQRERFEFMRLLTLGFLESGRCSPIPPFRALMLDFSDAERLAIARSYAKLGVEAAAGRGVVFNHAPREPGRRLRIGYVAGEFREHATAHLMRSLFGLHDRGRFEIYAYALKPGDESHYHLKIAADCDAFVDIPRADPVAAAKRIHADQIDILVDLCGYTGAAQFEIFALRPAPVNVAYLGYPGTTGAEYMDFIVADPIVLPEGNRPYFTEAPLLLSHSYQVNDQWQPVAERPFSRADLALPDQGVIFASVSRGDKIDPGTFSAWMEVLRAVPDSVLWLLAIPEHDAKANLRKAAEHEGVAASRILFGPGERKDRHLRRLGVADLFLDSFMYNAHTAASDALWAGVPVITRKGGSFASRVGASLLSAVGLPELIAESTEEFVQLAVTLARDEERRRRLKEHLKGAAATPLYDTTAFARDLERLFLQAWEARGVRPRV